MARDPPRLLIKLSILFAVPHQLWSVAGPLAYTGKLVQDKNPDPAASKYFAEYLQKAYKALTGAWLRLLPHAAPKHACGDWPWLLARAVLRQRPAL